VVQLEDIDENRAVTDAAVAEAPEKIKAAGEKSSEEMLRIAAPRAGADAEQRRRGAEEVADHREVGRPQDRDRSADAGLPKQSI
jgi:hypothetical protein